ncbi:hypothetical protein DL764_001420 [Monosporascus ibericus]|uniref:Uncharacterized protein n=1 Tax=Monosporascus ibericus TaxID=155417 RepID=A0A4Q4TS45_9PEZI|nr:hypothetical protein DL764_001420 [Monosporascus ibericus]
MCMKATCGECSKSDPTAPLSVCSLESTRSWLTLLATPNSGKTTWFGCGRHIPEVLDKVPADEWCTCEPKVEVGGKKYPPKSASR